MKLFQKPLDMEYIYRHNCGRPLVYIEHRPLSGEVLSHGHSLLMDGSRPEFGDILECACGEVVELDTRNIFSVEDYEEYRVKTGE